ncbi:hypothetical protein C8C83_1629 [Flavobacterium sp. 90]|uniref:hypothetical protein n=1 Tax=unclassified Flavobacterium TaxID=196869 RepID=UPI000EAF58DE|nr:MULTISPECIES: hypothetical protein [unclassified Flavobacterium]RKR09966.1 hypothetical protein C8C82_1931 [Flavobacterium sp. 81]TCK53750.1 hypothetical protein C8C83_1629 [Flavobacterium sp. 90]
MKKYIFILIVVVISSCNNSKKAEVADTKVVKKELRPFFDSGKIDHYYLNFSDNDFMKIIRKETNTEKEKEFIDIYEFDFPDTIPQENFEKILLNHKYKKMDLTIKQQKDIQDVFSEKDSLMTEGYACAAEYRDIFLFKKKEKTVGIAKICFKCGRFQITGSKLDTNGFGLWYELDRLKSIIRPNEKP